MKRTPITPDLTEIPLSFHRFFDGTAVYDSSCSRAARVLYLDRDGGYYLKSAPCGTLSREVEMTRYFHKLGIGAEVLGYESDGKRDHFLTRRVPGEDATAEDYLREPARLASLLGETLRMLHEMPTVGCPAPDYLSEYLARAEENDRSNNYDVSHFPDSFGYRSAEEARAALASGRHLLCADTLIHGDYCLPNVLLDGWRFSGFIDVGNSGIGDRHIDLFWGIWSLSFNLGTHAFRDVFLDAYGRDRVDEEMLKIVAAAEVFG